MCLNCRFHDPNAYNECRESSAERVRERDRANRCEYFSPGIARVAVSTPPGMRPAPPSTICSRRAEVESFPEGEAHVWLANPEESREPALLERYLALLEPVERERHQRLRRRAARGWSSWWHTHWLG